MLGLKQKQAAAVNKMLNLNADISNNALGWGEQWKLLVYDRCCRDIISPLLTVSELRKQGITLHMLLESDREDIPDVPAVYFISPTAENIQRVVKDLGDKLYTSIHLNFVRPVPRPLLEDLAKSSLSNNTVAMLTKIYDQTLDYVCLEPNLFTFNDANSYITYNHPKAKDADIEQFMTRIVQGLFSVLATMGVVPVIQAPKGGPAEMVARQLHEMLKEHLVGRSQLFSDSFAGGFQRPVLILLDRNLDLVTPIHHSSTYQALVDDLLKLRMNRVTISDAAGKRKVYDLDVAVDDFYKTYGGSPFPEAIEANAKELADVTAKEEEIRQKTSGGGGGGDVTGELAGLVEQLPKLMEKKKGLEQHTTILQAAMDLVAARDVPSLYETASTMVTTGHADKATLMSMIQNPEQGTILDKLRLMSVCYLATNISVADLAELEATLAGVAMSNAAPKKEGAAAAPPRPPGAEGGGLDDLKALTYLKKHQHFKQKMSAMHGEPQKEGKRAALLGFASKMGAGGLLAKVTESVQSFIPSSSFTYSTRVAKAVCENKQGTASEADDFLYLDPKVKTAPGTEAPRQKTPFQKAIVFMIGGGNYSEFQNLQDFARTAPTDLDVLYGTTEMLNSERFLEQLRDLGKEN